MAYEPAVIEQWIYETLTGDSTLMNLLAPDNLPSGYQQSVYGALAPQIDAISRKPPQLPYVVFDRAGSAGQDADVICGSRVFTYPTYRITVWDSASGAVSMAAVEAIMSRIDTLLDNQRVTTTTPVFYCRRESSGQTFGMSDGGRTDFGVTGIYRFVTQQ